MELRSLHYFVRIAELGSITRASAHLHVAQPALTRHVQRLEDELGVTLFTRANRGVRLTEGGQKLLESAQRIRRDVERTGDEIRAHKAHPSGKIVLAVTGLFNLLFFVYPGPLIAAATAAAKSFF